MSPGRELARGENGRGGARVGWTELRPKSSEGASGEAGRSIVSVGGYTRCAGGAVGCSDDEMGRGMLRTTTKHSSEMREAVRRCHCSVHRAVASAPARPPMLIVDSLLFTASPLPFFPSTDPFSPLLPLPSLLPLPLIHSQPTPPAPTSSTNPSPSSAPIRSSATSRSKVPPTVS